MLTREAAIAANRFGLGARPGDAERIGRDARGWLLAQLEPQRGTPRSTGPPASAAVLVETRELRLARQIRQQARANLAQPQGATPPPAPGIDAQAIREYGAFVRDHYVAQTNARHRRAIETGRPFAERLVHFWSNHFAVSADKQPLAALAGLYEDEAIRPHVAGHFYDLLLAVERHPAMILYLDNQTSMGESSTAANLVRRNRGRELGLNENLAREILELHTLGVDGGYSQQDVTELARVITGWSIGGALGEGNRPALARFGGDAGKPGEFHFRAAMHEPGTKTILGKQYRERGADEGADVLRMLASQSSRATGSSPALSPARSFSGVGSHSAIRIEDASLLRIDRLPPRTRSSSGSPSGATPMSSTRVPGTRPSSISRLRKGRSPPTYSITATLRIARSARLSGARFMAGPA
jgi:uncharacterized protein (DUF1800 family)